MMTPTRLYYYFTNEPVEEKAEEICSRFKRKPLCVLNGNIDSGENMIVVNLYRPLAPKNKEGLFVTKGSGVNKFVMEILLNKGLKIYYGELSRHRAMRKQKLQLFTKEEIIKEFALMPLS
jgi:hypothetical protein